MYACMHGRVYILLHPCYVYAEGGYVGNVSCQFVRRAVNPTHPSPSWVTTVHNWVQGKKMSILRFIATSEIFLMVVVVFNIFR